MQQLQVESILHKLGLNNSETKVIFAGLKLGPSSIIQLSKETRLQRITTHAIVDKLIHKWIFLETKNKTKRLVYPADAKCLDRLLLKKKQEVEILENEMTKAQKFIENLQNRSQWFANVRFYKWKEWVQLMINEIVSDKQNIFVMCDSRYFYDLIDNQFLEKTLEMRQKNNLTAKMLFPMGFEYFCFSQWVYEQSLNIRALPETWNLIWWLNIWGNKVGFHTEKNWFITTTIIEDEQISQIMIFLFENIWVGAKEY